MNEKDLKILANLRKNARMSLTDISRDTSIPITTIFDKLKLFENKLILKHTSLLDFNKLGYNTRAKVILKVKNENKEELRNHLKNNQNVNSLYKINNNHDFLIEVIFKHIVDLESFLDNLEDKYGVLEKSVFYILEDIKREGFLENINLYGGNKNGKKRTKKPL